MRALFTACLVATVCGDHAPLHVTVDLNVEPEHRWDHIIAEHKAVFVEAINAVLNDKAIKKFVPLLKMLLGNEFEGRRLFGAEQFREGKGVAQAMGVDFAAVALVGAFYDLFAAGGSPLFQNQACTGVVAQSSTGEIFHGRNLDYPFKGALGKIVLAVDFQRNGTTLFSAVTFGPNPTFNTAVKYGSFSITHNERDTGNILDNLFDVLIRGRLATFSAIRQSMETVDTFDGAVKFFSNVRLVAASYFILGGTNPTEGAVITRDRDGIPETVPISTLGSPSSETGAGSWYVLETNYDHTAKPQFGDDRRAVLKRALEAKGPAHFNASSMWEVISVATANMTAGERAPLNGMTIYSAVMQAAEQHSFKVVVRSSSKYLHTTVVV